MQVELVEWAHDVVARGVLDGEVGDDEIGRLAITALRSASAGSTFTARRRPTTLASRPTVIAMTNSHEVCPHRDLDRQREHRCEQRADDRGQDRGRTDRITAWIANPPASEPLECRSP